MPVYGLLPIASPFALAPVASSPRLQEWREGWLQWVRRPPMQGERPLDRQGMSSDSNLETPHQHFQLMPQTCQLDARRSVPLCTPATSFSISSVDCWVRKARLRTSSATTANPSRPASPARAGSMAALSASRLVCCATALMTSRTTPILSLCSFRWFTVSAELPPPAPAARSARWLHRQSCRLPELADRRLSSPLKPLRRCAPLPARLKASTSGPAFMPERPDFHLDKE